MENIRTAKDGDNVYYVVSDVCRALGIPWNGRTLIGIDADEVKMLRVADRSDTINTYNKVISEAGVDALCELKGKESPLPKTNVSNSYVLKLEKRVALLEKQLGALKDGVARDVVSKVTIAPKAVAVQTTGKVSLVGKKTTLTKAVKPGKVVNVVEQAKARKAVRTHCEQLAVALAAKDGANENTDKQYYHNLAYTALYSGYAKDKNVDFRKKAKELSTNSSKFSALRAAETLGQATELLKYAKENLKIESVK